MTSHPGTAFRIADAGGPGQAVLRKEDDALVTGRGAYSDDQNLPGLA